MRFPDSRRPISFTASALVIILISCTLPYRPSKNYIYLTIVITDYAKNETAVFDNSIKSKKRDTVTIKIISSSKKTKYTAYFVLVDELIPKKELHKLNRTFRVRIKESALENYSDKNYNLFIRSSDLEFL